MKVKRFFWLTAVAAFAVLAFSTVSMAQVVVTPANAAAQGWSTADTRPGGSVSWVVDSTAPGGEALRLTTDGTTTAKAQFMHGANTPLAQVTELSYWTKQVNGPPHADPSYQLVVCLNGYDAGTNTCNGFTTFVFEPYQHNGLNPPTQPIAPNQWQFWDVDQGQFWSSRTVACSNGGVQAGGGGTFFYTLSQLNAMCPNATATGFGVNIGSNNPGYNVYTDLVSFNGVVTDFELYPNHRDQCKDGGWQFFLRANNTPFKNQGDCIQYMNTGK